MPFANISVLFLHPDFAAKYFIKKLKPWKDHFLMENYREKGTNNEMYFVYLKFQHYFI
jgi:hypothetical protein